MSRLQTELKQGKPFQSLQAESLLSIVRTAAVLEHAVNDALKPFGLTMTQYNVLRILRGSEGEGLCGKEIAVRLVNPSPDVARLLDRMEEAGLLARERSTTDRRYVTTRITPKGLGLLDTVDPVLQEVQAARVGSLDNNQLESLVAILEAIR